MTHLEIRTQGFDELHPFLEYQGAKQLEFKAVNIVQGATSEGRTGVELFFEDAEGNKYVAGSTGRMMLNGLGGALRGTMERFNDDYHKA